MRTRKLHMMETLPGVWFLLVGFGFFHGLLRLSASWNLGENDPKSAINAQSLERLMGSGAASFDVLTYWLFELLGPSALVFQILRYGLLIIALVLVFSAVRRIFNSGFWAILTVESYVLIYQVTWRLHEGFTYPLIAMVMIAGMFWSFSLLHEKWSFTAFLFALWFAVAGGLTGIWFWIFCLSLLVAFSFMQNLTNRWWLMTVAFVGFATSSVYLGLTGSSSDLTFQPFAFGAAFNAIINVVAYLSPLLPVVIIAFKVNLLRREPTEHPLITLIRFSFFSATFILAISAFVMTGFDYATHALAPLFLLTPIWLMDCVRRTDPSARQIKLYCGAIICAIFLCFIARGANLLILDPICKRCYFGVPYQGLVTQLKANKAFDGADYLSSPSHRLTGNIYVRWREGPVALHPDEKPEGKTLFLWNGEMSPEARAVWMGKLGLNKQEQAHLLKHQGTYEVPWPHLWRPAGYRSTTWHGAMLGLASD